MIWEKAAGEWARISARRQASKNYITVIYARFNPAPVNSAGAGPEITISGLNENDISFDGFSRTEHWGPGDTFSRKTGGRGRRPRGDALKLRVFQKRGPLDSLSPD